MKVNTTVILLLSNIGFNFNSTHIVGIYREWNKLAEASAGKRNVGISFCSPVFHTKQVFALFSLIFIDFTAVLYRKIYHHKTNPQENLLPMLPVPFLWVTVPIDFPKIVYSCFPGIVFFINPH